MAGGQSQEFEARELRSTWTAPVLAALYVLPIAATVPFAAGIASPWTLWVAVPLAYLVWGARRVARGRAPFAEHVPVRVRVEEDALVLETREGVVFERLSRASLERGLERPTRTGTRVCLSRSRGRSCELTFESRAEALTFLDLLGLGVGQAVASFRCSSRVLAQSGRLFATCATVALASLIASALLPSSTPLILLTGLAITAVLTLWPSHVEVGGDGVLVRWLGRRRFIPHADIADVVQRTIGMSPYCVVHLALRSGGSYQLPTASILVEVGETAELAQRVLDARHAHAKRGATAGSLLFRGERPHREWVRSLRTRDVVGLRTPAVQKDTLWRVVESPSEDGLERAAAAIALGEQLSDAERVRMARVAKTAALPKLRVVLEATTEADDAQLAELLAELESEAAPRRRRG